MQQRYLEFDIYFWKMIISLKQLKKIIKEEFILSCAVPDFVLIQALDKTTNALREALLKHIQLVSKNESQRHQALIAAEEMLAEFKNDVRTAFETRLTDFLNKFMY